LLREHDVHREQDPRRRVDRHRDRDLLEVDAVEERFHVGERVDRDAFATDFAFAHRMVRVVSHERRHVEVGRDAGLTLRDEILEADVRIFARAEAGNLAHRPIPRTVHRRIRPARKRVTPGKADVFDRRVRNVGGRVGTLHREVAEREKLRLAFGLLL
jgi:hypothetical protein